MPRKKKSSQEVSTIVAKAPASQQEVWSAEQISLIKNTVAKGATDDELKLFLYTAKRTGLDPLTKQVHFVKRGNSMTIQTGIDGYRAIAERTGQLAGIEDAKYELGDTGMPIKATVTVYRIVKGLRVPFEASARWNEYVPQGGQSFMWQRMPFLMLGKVAESLALRKAFPMNLSGLYTNEEMQQAEVSIPSIKSSSESGPVGDMANDSYEREQNEHIGQDVTKQKRKEISLKSKIAFLCKTLGIDITAVDLPERVRALTSLDINTEENFEEIVNRLEFIVAERKEQSSQQ